MARRDYTTLFYGAHDSARGEAPAEVETPAPAPEVVNKDTNLLKHFRELGDVEKSQEGLTLPATTRAKKPVISDTTSLEDRAKINAELEAQTKANKQAGVEKSRLSNSASVGLSSEPADVPSAKVKISAKKLWSIADKLQTKMQNHWDSLPSTLAARAQAHHDAANRIDAAFHGPKGDLNVGKVHPVSAALRDSAEYLKKSANTSSLREQLSAGNNLTEARAILNAQINRGKGGVSFKSQDSSRIHYDLGLAVKALSSAHSTLNRGALTNYGIGSPVHPDEMKHLDFSHQNLVTEHGGPKPIDINAEENRDVDTVIAKYHPVTKALLNPDEALAAPGHVWFGDRTDGLKQQVEATPENVKNFTSVYGKQHADVVRLRSMSKAITKGVVSRVPRGRATVGLDVDRSAGTAGTKERAVEAPTRNVTEAEAQTLKENRAASAARRRQRYTSTEPSPEQVNTRLRPGGEEVLIANAAELLRNGQRISKNHRSAIGVKGVAEAQARAKFKNDDAYRAANKDWANTDRVGPFENRKPKP
jgi:hypothetical protein